jgi:Ca-activated chloride channel family protein
MLLIVALSRPRFSDERQIVRAEGIDIILAVDLSESMIADNIDPAETNAKNVIDAIENQKIVNRLAAEKKVIWRFSELRPNDRIGLIGFADLAYSFAPPTLDHQWLLARLSQLKPGMIGTATGIAAPIGVGVNRLKNSDAPRRVLVLFTDGANTAANRLTPQQAAAAAKDLSVILHTVGIGSNNAYVLADSAFGKRFVPAGASYDQELLAELASLTGGSFFKAAYEPSMRKVMDEINSLEKTSFTSPRYVKYREFAHIFAVIAIAMMLLGYTAETTFELKIP